MRRSPLGYPSASLRALAIVATAAVASACNAPSSDDPSAAAGPEVRVSSFRETTYDASTSQLRITGSTAGIDPSFTQLDFHLQSTCVDNSIGSGSVSDFTGKGIDLKLPSGAPSAIYARFLTVGFSRSSCLFVVEYDPNHGAPSAPVFSTSAPATPGKSLSPKIRGTLSPNTSEVTLYDDAGCSHAIGTGSAGEYMGAGIAAAVAANSTTAVYARAIEPFGSASACALQLSYLNDSLPPAPPAFTLLTPASPSSASTSPTLKGTASSDSVSVSLFLDSGCTLALATGTKATFESVGLQIAVPANATSQIYGEARDAVGNASTCTFFTTYSHDDTAPGAPQFSSSSPPSPTRLTVYPKLIGTSSADTSQVRIYDDPGCTSEVGSGTKPVFEGAGIPSRVAADSVTSLYARAFDTAGNGSPCSHLTDFVHDATGPDAPLLGGTTPDSPSNSSVTPLVFGNPSADTTNLQLFSDIGCTTLIGAGSSAAFLSPGIQVSVQANHLTHLYARAYDQVGNASSCTLLGDYSHDNSTPGGPGFTLSSPPSPSNSTTMPWIQGTAPVGTALVSIYGDAACGTLIGSGSRSDFQTGGIRVTVASNATTPIYAKVTNAFSTSSACTHLTDFIHDSISPVAPSLVSMTPTSPSSTSTTPVFKGSASSDTVTVSLYDSAACTNKIGTGSKAGFEGAGIATVLPANSTTSVYALAFDAAGNSSLCTAMSSFTHDSIGPVKPTFLQVSPGNPSYSRIAVIRGNASSDTAHVSLYSDSSCSSLLGDGTKATFQSPGISILAAANSTTSVYGRAFDALENRSTCNLMLNFVHSDAGPGNLAANLDPNGSVSLSWNPDSLATSYTVKRATQSGGPYSVLSSGQVSSSYNDAATSNGAHYYYVVSAANGTGNTRDSSEISALVSVSAPSAPGSLSASPGNHEVSLSWTGLSSAMSYSLLRSTTPGGPYSTVVTGLTLTSYRDTGLTNGTGYYYVAIASNPAGSSAYSSEASAVAEALPPAPVTVQAAVSGTGVLVSWNAPAYATRFSVRRGTTAGTLSEIAQVSGTTYLDPSPPKGILYYAISTVWNTQFSANSTPASVAYVDPPTLSAVSGNHLATLTWNDISAANYQVKRSTTAGGPYVTIAGPVTGTTYTDLGAANGTAYFYVVTGNMGGSLESPPSIEASALPAAAPSAPTGLSVSIIGNKPLLKWSGSSSYTSYRVKRSSTSGGPYTVLATTSSLIYSDGTPLSGMNYYIVTAYWGGVDSAASNEVRFRSTAGPVLTAAPASSEVDLSWTSVSGATSYQVKSSTLSGGPYSVLNASVSGTSLSDSAAPSGTGTFYVVTANFADGTESLPSVEAAGSPGSDIPGSLQITATTSVSASLKWAPVEGATGYTVKKSSTSGGTYSTVTSGIATSSATVTGLASGSYVYFVVTATTSGGESAPSSVVGARIASPMAAPVVVAGSGKVGLSWSATSGAASYLLQRSTDGVVFSDLQTVVAATSYNDTTALDGSVYFYRIRPTYTNGVIGLFSAKSSAAAPGLAPLAPGGLAITADSVDTVTLAWGKVSGATSYTLKSSTSSGGPYATLQSGLTDMTASASGLTAGTTYYFVVSATIGSLESSDSAQASIVPLAQPAAPSATASTTQVSVSWAGVAGASTYDLQRSPDGVVFTTVQAATSGTSYTDSAAPLSAPAFYRFIPNFASGASGTASAVSAPVTPGISPLAPSGLAAQALDSSSAFMNWIAVPGAASYRLKRGTASGGPYSLVATTASTAVVDLALTPGTSYYYVVSSVNASGVESADSAQAAVTLTSAPAGLAASSSNGQISLSWSAVGGAASYHLKRSSVSGGPYSDVSSSVAALSTTDSSVADGVTYYYIVAANFADGSSSLYSNEASATGIAHMNLEVPVELTDAALASDTSAVTFERTRTSIDTTEYDGTVTYAFDLVATNLDASDHVISLVNGSAATAGSVTVPAGTSSPTRFRAPWTPTAGADDYRLELDGTPSAGALQLSSARVLIQQVGATRTRLYIPLLSSALAPSSLDALAQVQDVTGPAYASLSGGSIHKRDDSAYSALPSANPYLLDAVVSAKSGASGYVGLYNRTTGAIVGDTETQVSSPGWSHVKAPFTPGASGFATANASDEYEISALCSSGCPAGSISIYKAGLWVRVTSLSQVEIPYRAALATLGISAPTPIENSRELLDTSLFSTPSIYFEATAQASSGSSTTTLATFGANDSGTAGASSIAGSDLTFLSTSGKTRLRSASPVNPTSGDRYGVDVAPASGSLDLTDSLILVRAVR